MPIAGTFWPEIKKPVRFGTSNFCMIKTETVISSLTDNLEVILFIYRVNMSQWTWVTCGTLQDSRKKDHLCRIIGASAMKLATLTEQFYGFILV